MTQTQRDRGKSVRETKKQEKTEKKSILNKMETDIEYIEQYTEK